ncbi:MAG: hypothetical protein HFJ85_00955, partial [Oscillospiraceae bacterium]|nr:hypothetical protein [Oscillospiraceae bacterium]
MHVSFKKRISRTALGDDRNRNLYFFAAEGAFFAAVTSLGNNTNNLFLTRLGASDYQLSLMTMLAQVLSMVCLVPLAIFTDRLKNKRSMVT